MFLLQYNNIIQPFKYPKQVAFNILISFAIIEEDKV